MAVAIFGLAPRLVDASPAPEVQTPIERYQLEIRRARLSDALKEFGEQTQLQIAHFTDIAPVDVSVGPLHGAYTREEALDILLRGTGLTYRFVNDRTIAIIKSPLPQLKSSAGNSPKSSEETVETPNKETTERGRAAMKGSGLIARITATLFACGAVGGAHTVCADEAAGTLEEVVVTAQRQQENLQKAPLAVTAVSSELFQRLGGGDVSALQMAAPDVQISTNGSGGGQIGIRGITTGNVTDVGDPAVLFEIDGIYQARGQTVGSTLFDVDRIEVLRGPQGTLYGRNATTGVINVITKKPTQDFAADGYVEYGNYRAFTGFGALNVPLTDSVAVRASFISVNHDPYFNNGFSDNNNYWDQHETAGRVHVSVKPLEDLSLLLTGDYSSQTGNGAPLILAFPSVPLSSNPYTFPVSQPGSLNLQQLGASALLEWRLPFATLTYDGGVHQSSMYQVAGANGATPSVTLSLDPLKSRTQQHELRISNSTDRFKYVAGLYYFVEHQVWDVYVKPAVAFLMPYEEQDSKAAFGQAAYSVTESLRITAGGRYTKDHKTRTGGNYGYDANGEPTVLFLPNFADIHSSKFNYRAGIDYDVGPTSMVYASYATGYKAGGFFDGTPPNNTYAPENVGSAEIGFKSRFLNNRLQLNIAAFRYKYTDFQVSFQDRTTLITKTYNAQEAKNTGLELEAEAAPDDSNRIGMSVTYLHARYSQFDFPGGAFDTYGFNSYSGKRLPYAPDWGINVDLEHSWHLANDHKITAGVLSHWQSQSDLEFHGFVNTKQGSYSKTDVNLAWGDVKGRYSVTAFVRNAENKAVLTGAALQSTTDPNAPAAGTLAPPRTYGVRVNFAL